MPYGDFSNRTVVSYALSNLPKACNSLKQKFAKIEKSNNERISVKEF
jgi:hypothetical protein